MKNNKVSVFKDVFKSTDVPFDLTLEEVVERIRKGTSKEKIECDHKYSHYTVCDNGNT